MHFTASDKASDRLAVAVRTRRLVALLFLALPVTFAACDNQLVAGAGDLGTGGATDDGTGLGGMVAQPTGSGGGSGIIVGPTGTGGSVDPGSVGGASGVAGASGGVAGASGAAGSSGAGGTTVTGTGGKTGSELVRRRPAWSAALRGATGAGGRERRAPVAHLAWAAHPAWAARPALAARLASAARPALAARSWFRLPPPDDGRRRQRRRRQQR